ncbi:MAG: hypothetical protein Kow0056_06550 [Coriobacteriia bacterium]
MTITRPLSQRYRAGLLVLLAGVALAPLLVIPQASGSAQAPRAALVGLACLAFLANGLRMRDAGTHADRRSRLAGRVLLALGVLLAVSAAVNGAASSVWGVHGRFQGLVAFAVYAACGYCGFLAASAGDGRERVLRLVPLLAGAALIEGVLALVQSAGGGFAVGTLVNPVLFGSWMCVAVGFLVPPALGGARLARRSSAQAPHEAMPVATVWLSRAAVVVGLAAVGAGGSRGAWVGLASCLCALAVAGLRSGSGTSPAARRPARSIWVGLVAVALVGAGALSGGQQVLRKLDPQDLTRGSAASRLAIWRDTAHMVADHPVLGAGVGRYLFEYPQYESLEHAQIEGPDVRPDQAHSIPLQIAAEGGVPAALLGIALWALAAGSAWRLARTGDVAGTALLAGLAAYGGQGLFGIMTVETQALAFFLGGSALGLASAAEEPASRISRPGVARRALLAAMVGLMAISCAWYAYVDAVAARSDEVIARARFDEAFQVAEGAVRANPLVDVYRVKMADAARFLAALGDDGSAVESLSVLDAGLRLEPADYDLALARARVLRAPGAPAARVLAAYERAASLYPMGVTVREEMASVEAALGALGESGSDAPEGSGTPQGGGGD